jgi:hypothetical protein
MPVDLEDPAQQLAVSAASEPQDHAAMPLNATTELTFRFVRENLPRLTSEGT